MQWIYESPLDLQNCMIRLSNPRIGQVDEMNPFRVEITRISDSQVYLVYRGRRFTKERKTEYLVSFFQDDALSVTRFIVVFKGELFRLPYPMTPITELDTFLKLALNACRVA